MKTHINAEAQRTQSKAKKTLSPQSHEEHEGTQRNPNASKPCFVRLCVLRVFVVSAVAVVFPLRPLRLCVESL
jgi:hypothetical protein